MQPHYNLIYREEEREMLKLCADQKVGVIPCSPVAKGLLTRKPSKERNETLRAQTDAIGKRMYSDEDLAIAQRVYDVAEARGLPMAQIALAWLLPNQSSLHRSSVRPNHITWMMRLRAVSVQLSPEEITQLEEAYQPHPVIGYA